MDQKIYTDRKYLNTPIKCLEDGVIFEDIKKFCTVLYWEGFREYNKVGKAIDQLRPIRGNHYRFLRD